MYRKRVPVIEIFNVGKNFDRTTPVFWIVLFAFLSFFLGAGIFFLRIFVLFGGLILFLFAGFWILWWAENAP